MRATMRAGLQEQISSGREFERIWLMSSMRPAEILLDRRSTQQIFLEI